MRGRWALGVAPRSLTWVIKDKLAVCERLGGYGTDHRPVRRIEEIIWFKRSEFTCLVSLIAGPQNVNEYQKEEVNYLHFPVSNQPPPKDLAAAYSGITKAMAEGETLLMHRERVDDAVAGFLAGYGLWRGRITDPTHAIAGVEQILKRPMGQPGREIVTNFADSGLTHGS